MMFNFSKHICPTEQGCQAHEFRCNTGECIDARRRCDRQRDCYDGSDEDGCGES